jgi:aspartate aminotransferase
VARVTSESLRTDLLGLASELWSSAPAPIQEAAAYGFTEPPELRERIGRSRHLHASVARGVAAAFRAAGAHVPEPAAAFYLYPDFEPLRSRLAAGTSAALAGVLLERHGVGVLAGSSFGEPADALRLRVATSLLYGDTDEQREIALTCYDPLRLEWIGAAVARLGDVLSDLTAGAPRRATVPLGTVRRVARAT